MVEMFAGCGGAVKVGRSLVEVKIQPRNVSAMRAGYQACQADGIAAVEFEGVNLLAGNELLDAGAFRLELRGGSDHFHGFRVLPDLQTGIDLQRGTWVKLVVGRFEFLEPFRAYSDVIVPRWDVSDRVEPIVVGIDAPFRAGRLIPNRNACICHDGPARIFNRSSNTAVVRLCKCGK